MKKLGLIPAILLLILVTAPTFSDPGRGEDLSLPPVKTGELDNGIRVFYVKDDLPQVTIIASMGYGMLHEDGNSAGMSRLLAEALSISGSKKYPDIELNKTVENLGGRLSIEASYENITVYVRVLERFRNRAFDIVSDILTNPNFNEKDLAAAKSLVKEEIRRSYDDPAQIAFMKAREIIFNGCGYGACATEKMIDSYALDMVKELWEKHAVGGNIYIGISESEGYGEVEGLIRKSFSPIRQGPRVDYVLDMESIRENLREKRGKIFLYPKDIPQSTIVIGTMAPDIHYEGSYALTMMNFILGGGSFNSRLVREIRVKRGLAYTVMSLVRFRYSTGIFLSFAQTANSTVPTAVSLMNENFREMAGKPVSGDELTWARNSIENSHVFKFTNTQEVLVNIMDRAFNRLPEDYYSDYVDNIRDVTAEAITAETEKLFNNGLITVVVGKIPNREEIGKFGTVVELQPR